MGRRRFRTGDVERDLRELDLELRERTGSGDGERRRGRTGEGERRKREFDRDLRRGTTGRDLERDRLRRTGERDRDLFRRRRSESESVSMPCSLLIFTSRIL